MVSCVGISGHDRVRRSGRDIVTACNARGSDREQRLSGNRIWLEHCLGHALFGNVSLRQRDWDRTHGDEQKQVKCTSDKVRFDTVLNLLFHGGFAFWGFQLATLYVQVAYAFRRGPEKSQAFS